MKFAKKQLLFYIIYLLAGALLFTAALLWSPENSKTGTMSGIIGGFLFTGVIGIISNVRLIKDPKKAEQAEFAATEERNQFLRSKSQASVNFVLTLLISAGAMIALIAGFKQIAIAFAAVLTIEAVLYIYFFSHYAKKY